MATVEEKFRGLSGDYSTRTLEFVVKDASDAADAITSTIVYIYQTYGDNFDGMGLQNVAVQELAYHKGLYETTASFSYGVDEVQPKTGSKEISFDQNLDTRRIYRSYSTADYKLAPGQEHVESHSRLNVQKGFDNTETVEGTDARIPVGGFVVTWIPPDNVVTETYRRTVLGMVGKVNNATFFGHPAGEVLFAGVSGRKRNAEDWEMAYRFDVNPTTYNEVVGEGDRAITIPVVEGWQYIWPRYARTKNENKQDVYYPAEIYIENIYKKADFSQLGLS